MIILGIDPGYAIVGYGVIECIGNRYIAKQYDSIFTYPESSFEERLNIIFENITELIKKYHPDAMAIEKLYFQNNHKTAIDVAQARGVIILAASRENVPIYEYTPLQIKSSVTGYGKAQKQQVMQMVKRLLGLKEIPKPDDTADALAAGICHINSSGKNNIQEMIVRASKIKNKLRSADLY